MLRATREQNALSLEEVEAQTRIRVKFLEALENGDLTVLPSSAHAKGFLRNYAQFLRLDANAITMQFGALTGTGTLGVTQSTALPTASPTAGMPSQGTLAPAFDNDPAPTSPASPTVPTPYPPPTGTGPLRTRSTYVPPGQRVGPGVPTGVPAQPAQRTFTTPPYGMTVPAMQPQVIQPERPSTPLHRLLQNNLFVGGVLVIAMVAIVWWAISTLSAIGSEQFATTPDSTDSIVALGSVTTTALSPFDTSSTPTAGGGASIPLDRVLLNITVTQRTWALIVVDGATAFEGQLAPGSVVQYQGATSILLRAGNGAGLTVNYNGQDLGVMGGPGEVVEIIFTPSGQITPTVTPTLTPTNTIVPSPTPRGGTATPTRKP